MGRLGVVTALRAETRALLAALVRPRRVRPAPCPTWIGAAGPHEVAVVQGGVGPAGAARALAALPAGRELLLSFGFAGGLVPGLGPGRLVVPATVLWEEHGTTRRYAVVEDLRLVVEGALATAFERAPLGGVLFSSPTVLVGRDAKRGAADRHAAVAVEMEAATIAVYAAARALPLIALRAVLDPAELSLEGLPPGLEASWAARARLLSMPRAWPLVATLHQCAAAAAAALARGARVVLPVLDPAIGRASTR